MVVRLWYGRTMAYSAADLEMANHHVAQGERHVSMQEALIARLRDHGLPTAAAEELLVEFQAILQQHRAHRDMMSRSLAEPSA